MTKPQTYDDLLKLAYNGLRETYTALYPPVERTYVAKLKYAVATGWQVYQCPRCLEGIIYHPAYAGLWRLECHCSINYVPAGNNELIGVGMDGSTSEHAMMRESIERLVRLRKRYPAAFENTKDD